jgi:hypothetical protein
MADRTSSLSIPANWQEHFLIKRIDEKDIEIDLEQRNAILQALNAGARFIQIKKYTLMLNSIKSIDPKYEPDNIPPRPVEYYIYNGDATKEKVTKTLANGSDIELWDKLYANKLAISNL